MIKLVFKDATGREAQFPLTSELTVGRDEKCDVVLADPRVSRRHARVYIEWHQAVIEDLGSRNGTFVNRRQIIEPRQLQPGDTISIGSYRLQLVETNPLMDYVAPTRIVTQDELNALSDSTAKMGPGEAVTDPKLPRK